MLPQEIIRAKRDGGTLDRDALAAFVRGVGEGTVTDAHIAAFTMAVFLRGMSTDEVVGLTTAMRDSGTVLRWDLPGPVLDKHSTGGVGDTVSLVLAPIVAACGGFVPMISGRGLGHTGGTLDKMASIPGYSVSPPLARFRRVVTSTGCAIIGQTADLAPADGRIYAVRDVTATVESIPLITASILSKKLAAGLDALVMDVKAGNGAFMATRRDAGALARSIVSVATGAGMPTEALVTDMDQPLADVAGNALEVAYAIEHLTGTRRDERFVDVTLSLAAEMLVLGRLARTPASARRRAQKALDSGEAAERFGRMVAALGGPRRLVDRPWQHLPRATVEVAISPQRPGTVRSIDTRAVGLAVVALGGGRTRPSDSVDPSVGLTRLAAIGDRVDGDRPIAIVHARSRADAETAAAHLHAAYRIGTSRAPAPRR
ncbi:MAG: thymidine phosphorylase [Actinomycetota bacterium]|jgi:thymidine phosphorylase